MDNCVIGIIGAMDAEVEGFASAMSGAEKRQLAGSDVLTGRIGGRSVAVMRSGIGKVNAAFAALPLARRMSARAIISTGVAGALVKLVQGTV